MQNQENKYKTIIEHIKSMLSRSYEGIKKKYLHYPISLTVHIENKISKKFIEIRFSEQQATVSLDFDQKDECNGVYLFLETMIDENKFIEYLTESYDFDFRKNYWLLSDCYLKVTNIKEIFCFYFFY